jgi:hypothetical protein
MVWEVLVSDVQIEVEVAEVELVSNVVVVGSEVTELVSVVLLVVEESLVCEELVGKVSVETELVIVEESEDVE